MTVQNTGTVPDELLEGWRQQAWLQRMLLPGDFLNQVSVAGAESLVCHKTTNEYMVMNDRVETKIVRDRDAGSYSADINYRPQEFKNETLKIMYNGRDVSCNDCSGRGQVPCSTTMECRTCRGTGQEDVKCWNCDGRGEYVSSRTEYRRDPGTFFRGSADSEFEHRQRCYDCRGRGKVPERCSGCGASGQVVCNRCNGAGAVLCKRCEGKGQLVEGEIITRKFSCSKELTYQLSGLGENEFKNGLDGKHFKSLEGDLIYQEFQTPGNPDTVLEQKSVHSYDVVSREYSYNGSSFCLNHITSGSASKYVASGVPLSKTKTAIAGAVFFVAAAAIAAVVILL